MNVFQIIDLFGKPIFLNFNGATRAKTRAGGVFSLLFFGFIIWAAYHISQDLFEHTNPKTISSEFFNENPEKMILGPETFTFGFGVQNPDTFAHYLDDSVYTFDVTKQRLDRVVKEDGTVEENWSSFKLETEVCTTSHFGELGPKFANIELSQLLCLTPAQTNSGQTTVQGVFESPVYEYIQISIIECDPKVRTCASDDRRKALLEGGFFAIYFTNMAFNPRDYNDPSFRYRDSTYTTFGRNFFKEATMLLTHVEVTSDSGWITREPQTQKFIKFDSQREIFTLKSDLTRFFNYVLRVDKITTKHDRSYVKMQDILAEVNGLATIGLLVAFIIVSPYSNLKFYEGLINELFDIKMLKDMTQKKKKILKKQMSLTHHIAHYIKPKGNDDDGDKGLEVMTPTSNPLKLDFDDGQDLEQAKPGNELRVNNEFNKKPSFLRVTLEDNLNSPFIKMEQERQILANRSNRKKTTSFHLGQPPEQPVSQNVETDRIQGNNEVKVIRGNLKKSSYYKVKTPESANTLLANIDQAEWEGEAKDTRNRKKASCYKASLSENMTALKSEKNNEKKIKKAKENSPSLRKQSAPQSFGQGKLSSPRGKDGELSARSYKKLDGHKYSENLNTQPGDIDECKDLRAPTDLYSAELGRNPFSYTVEEGLLSKNRLKSQEVELQESQRMNQNSAQWGSNKGANLEGSAGLPIEKLQQDIPKAVKPNLQVMENYDNMDSVEIILETIVLDKQQEGKRDGKVERLKIASRELKSRSQIIEEEQEKESKDAESLAGVQQEKCEPEGSQKKQEPGNSSEMLKVESDPYEEEGKRDLNVFAGNQPERSQGEEEKGPRFLRPEAGSKLKLREDGKKEGVDSYVVDQQEKSRGEEQAREQSAREESQNLSVQKFSRDLKTQTRLENHELFSPAMEVIARDRKSKKSIILKEASKLDFTFWEYIKSYVWRTDELREKLSVLNEGSRRIDERLDIFNVFKKLREVDKLKLLLLENEQLVLFDGLPKPELKSKNCLELEESKTLSRHLLREARFISERRKQDLIAISYENLKGKPETTLIDQKLLDIYDEMAN